MRGFAVLIAILAVVSAAVAQVPPSESDRARYEGLHRAALDDDAAAVARLVAEGADPGARDRRGRTPVHVAAFASADAAPRALAEAGADRSIGDRQGVTPLQHAEARGFEAMADIIRAGGP